MPTDWERPCVSAATDRANCCVQDPKSVHLDRPVSSLQMSISTCSNREESGPYLHFYMMQAYNWARY